MSTIIRLPYTDGVFVQNENARIVIYGLDHYYILLT
jgi:hypothetical protein